MKELKQAILLAASIHETSWDGKRYLISIEKAANKAAERLGFDLQANVPIFLLLSNSWNESIDWAKDDEDLINTM